MTAVTPAGHARPIPVVGVKPNPKRAAILGDEAAIADLVGRPDVAAYLKNRAMAWLLGQKRER